jgi:hypothetical protein
MTYEFKDWLKDNSTDSAFTVFLYRNYAHRIDELNGVKSESDLVKICCFPNSERMKQEISETWESYLYDLDDSRISRIFDNVRFSK